MFLTEHGNNGSRNLDYFVIKWSKIFNVVFKKITNLYFAEPGHEWKVGQGWWRSEQRAGGQRPCRIGIGNRPGKTESWKISLFTSFRDILRKKVCNSSEQRRRGRGEWKREDKSGGTGERRRWRTDRSERRGTSQDGCHPDTVRARSQTLFLRSPRAGGKIQDSLSLFLIWETGKQLILELILKFLATFLIS